MITDEQVTTIFVVTTSGKSVLHHALHPAKLTETNGTHTVSRTQFPLLSSVGLLPWALQGLTISENIFYDNTRSSEHYTAIKGLLYTVMSRVNKKEQFSFLHQLTRIEITNGVNKKALEFDNKYRLITDEVVFDLLEEVTFDD
jgi:hypothetical protein